MTTRVDQVVKVRKQLALSDPVRLARLGEIHRQVMASLASGEGVEWDYVTALAGLMLDRVVDDGESFEGAIRHGLGVLNDAIEEQIGLNEGAGDSPGPAL